MYQPWVYIVLVGLVFIVYATLVPKASLSNSKTAPSINEIEQTMEHFAGELEEQNEALIRQLSDIKKDNEVHHARLSSRIEALEFQFAQSNQEFLKLGLAYEELQKKLDQRMDMALRGFNESAAAQQEGLQDQAVDEAEIQHEALGMNIRNRYAELFELYEQGKSVDTIARKMNMNKGEVNLILQLAKQEEQLNAQK